MKKITFEKPERDAIVGRIQRYFADELEQDIGVIPAQFLLDFFTAEIGGFYYNQGLTDAQAVFAKSLDDVNDRIYGLEQRDARAR
jgi:uncharacterized protein (DUF2164 family)